MGYITFTDATGAAQLDNGLTGVAGGVGSRFVGWKSDSTPIGDAKEALGTGQRFMFQFRVDYTAEFEVQDIPNANTSTLDRLIAHLLGGGVVAVYTGDSAARSYTNCCLAPGSTPSKRMFSREDITWALQLRLLNLSAAPMLCLYT